MLTMKVIAMLYVLSTAIILGGFVVEYALVDGNTARMLGYLLLLLVYKFQMMADDNTNRWRMMSRELQVLELVAVLVELPGSLLSLAGVFSTSIMGTRAFVCVGVVGSSLMVIGGMMSLVKELVIEQLEEENQAKPT